MPGPSRRLLRHAPLLAIGVFAAVSAVISWPSSRALAMMCVAAGALMNVLVIGLNRGYMPYAAGPDDAPDPPESIYRPIDAHTRAWWLADWIDTGAWYLSPGDVILIAGLLAWLIAKFQVAV